MVSYMNEHIFKKVDEIVNYIEQSSPYQSYQKLSIKVKNNQEIMSIIDEVKRLQKEAANKEYRYENIDDINNEIDFNVKKLSEYPIYQEMVYYRDDLDNLFQMIKNMLDSYISDQIN